MKIEDEISQKKFRNEWQKAVINVIFTSSWLQLKIKEHIKEYGITMQQYNVLRILKGQHPNPVSTQLIRSRMLDKMSDVSRIISRLQEKDLVSVARANHDKRLVDIVVTTKGLDLILKVEQNNDKLDSIAKKLTADEAMQVSDLLDKMRG